MSKNPFHRDNEVDHPGIIGARWWNKSVVESAATQGRRVALLVLGASVVGVMGLCTLGIVGAASSASDDEKEEQQKSLKLQQEYGWKFDVPTASLTYDRTGETPHPSSNAHVHFVRAAIKTIVEDLSPSRPDLTPFYVSTLFQSPEALPKVIFPDQSNANMKPIAEDLRPFLTARMVSAEARGAGVGDALAAASPAVAVIVDLPGPESVAFAAGAVQTHDIVFLLDNWPHPNGVVGAHNTLAAAVLYRERFLGAKAKRPQTAPPMFVLDRNRLAPYVDQSNKFDNRWAARLPPASALQSLGVKRVLYVAPIGSRTVHLSDLEQAFTSYREAKVDVRALFAEAFTVRAGQSPALFGGTKERTAAFLSHYGWGAAPAGSDTTGPLVNDEPKQWSPPRVASADPSITTIGVTTVAVALATGYVVRRSGTWNRATDSYGGG